MGEIGRNATSIAMALISVSMIALLIGHSKGTAEVAGSVLEGFNGLLKTVSLQNNFNMGMSQ